MPLTSFEESQKSFEVIFAADKSAKDDLKAALDALETEA